LAKLDRGVIVKFYILVDPKQPSRFAQFAHVGTWKRGKLCPGCGHPTSRLIEPLQVMWDPGTETIGDFSWCGYTFVVTPKARSFLRTHGFECSYKKVVVKKPDQGTRMPRVAFPYKGPSLKWVEATCLIDLNEARSGVKLVVDCSACGHKRYSFKQTGLSINKNAWDSHHIFRIRQFEPSSPTYITEDALELLLSNGISNVGRMRAGVIV
jgi:hypothetical protein